ncbi:MAG: tRNA (adenosine(37)-N6)-dimethylallyltransferase MiaA [Alphaproteobacteria bacterium]|nr:tRNA (adenosine(37)-N6)-dimethylallyltransferase MiaA [Alphaproteobacteria bacterium]
MSSDPSLPDALITVLVVAGPTASGKSAFALEAAEALGGVVINADSMQVFRELRILTARPSPEDEARVPHRLYGVLSAAEKGSAAWWRDRALSEIDAAHQAGRIPIVTGGTGLYLRALIQGIATIPPVPEGVVAEAQALQARIGGVAFHQALGALDPVLAARLQPGDTQRLLRGWAVATATGRPLSAWQADVVTPPAGLRFISVLLFPPSPASVEAIERRFRLMIDAGAVDEARALTALELNRSLPAMKALGVLQLIDFIEEKYSLDAAIEATVIATRQYAKRQRTWFRHQFVSNWTLDAQFSKSSFQEIFPKIHNAVLTPES